MKNLLTKTLFISLFLSAVIPSGVQASSKKELMAIEYDLIEKMHISKSKATDSLEKAVIVSMLTVVVAKESIGTQDAILVGLIMVLGIVGPTAFKALTDVIIET